VAPVVSAGDPAALVEGGTLTRTGSFADPGADVWSARVNYGDGMGWQPLPLNPDKTFALSHTYGDNGNFTVTVEVNDAFAPPAAASFAVAVSNANPTARLSNAGPVNEGGTTAVSFAAATDPSPADALALRYSFDFNNDGTFEVVNSTSPTEIVPASYLANGPFARVVRGRVSDDDGGFTDYLTDVLVLNVAPTAAAARVPGPTVEGTPLHFTGTYSDPGAEPVSLSWVVVAGNGQVVPGGTGPTFSFTPTDDGTYTLLFKATDADGAVGVSVLLVTVQNAAPAAGVAGPSVLPVGEPGTFTLTAADPSPVDQAAGFTFHIDWNGDGVSDETVSGPSGVTVDHTFASLGFHTVRVRAADKDGAVGPETVLTVPVVSPTGSIFLAGGDLCVFGTAGDDTIRVSPAGPGGVRVVLNGTTFGPFFPTGKVKVFAGAGNDTATIDAGVVPPTEVYGEDGRDTLTSGSGNDRLDGGGGNDSLDGGSGNDNHVGDYGNDVINVGFGEDSH
jgi:hypothetical protein